MGGDAAVEAEEPPHGRARRTRASAHNRHEAIAWATDRTGRARYGPAAAEAVAMVAERLAHAGAKARVNGVFAEPVEDGMRRAAIRQELAENGTATARIARDGARGSMHRVSGPAPPA